VSIVLENEDESVAINSPESVQSEAVAVQIISCDSDEMSAIYLISGLE